MNDTFWNGLPTPATRGTAVVIDSGYFPEYWAKTEGIIGQRIAVVRVDTQGGTFYLDDRDGSGWRKVTEGHGGPRYPHRNVDVSDWIIAGLYAPSDPWASS